MNINTAYPSKYLRASDLDQDETYTIKNVTVETVGQGKDAEDKPICYFQETEKGFLMNKTNAKAVAHLHGPETDDWVGKQITLFVTEVEFGGEMTLALRVRLRAPKAAAPARPAAAPASIGGNGTTVPAADAAKRTAWQAFKSCAVPGTSAEAVAAEFKAAAHAFLPGKDPQHWSVADWQAFVGNEFMPRKVQSPVSEEPIFDESSVPF